MSAGPRAPSGPMIVPRLAPGAAGLTPLMRQYHTAKAEHPDAVLLFRMGDFWETFYEDAVLVSQVLGIALTSRGMDRGERVPLAGVPLPAFEPSVAKLLKAGHRVAVCDQVEDPRTAKGIVRREVVEVLSAGTATLPALLAERESRWLVAVLPDAEAGRAGLARCDVSTGEFVATELSVAALADELDRLAPAEILAPDGELPPAVAKALRRSAPLPRLAAARFAAPDAARERLAHAVGFAASTTEAPFLPLAVSASAALVDYLEGMRKAEGRELRPLAFEEGEETLVLDDITLRNLEILVPLREGPGSATLLSVVDRTRTPMGARRLRHWLARPLLSPERIGARHDAVAEIAGDAALSADIADVLARVGDVERLTMRVVAARAHARDVVALADSLEHLPRLKEALGPRASELLKHVAAGFSDFAPEVDLVREAIVDGPPLAVMDGGVIRAGYSEELDHLRELAGHGKEWIAALQASERERTGIANLRVGFNRVFGYYLEVTKSNHHLVPPDWERRQTLVGAERYVTPALKEREAEILGAEEKSKTLEYDLFLEVRDRLALAGPRLRLAGESLAVLDVLASFAQLAAREGWARPSVHDGDRISVRGGRHPVVEASLPAHEFVPNDVYLDGDTHQILVVTGPNMAGKSTYLRQVALLVILAQTGSFVPAEDAEIGVCDRVFTRVGASDQLAAGQSTFMVEMVEVARILGAATPRSLVLLDEVGRGTSTYDGLAIAWAVLEHLHENPARAARTLFATHFHELAELAESLPRARNLRVTVHEWKDDVVFLRKVVEGAADRSFGIHVAKLAGLPRAVTDRAKEILAKLEERAGLDRAGGQAASGSQLELFSGAAAAVLTELKTLDPDAISPREALAVLAEWKRRTTEGDAP
ncbi:MAG: DNA mismatch repair protein MutS [bacterium]